MNAMVNDISQYLSFGLGDETFAIGIRPIREIFEAPMLTAIPMTPPYVRGVINVRGAVVPVIDLALRFGRASTEIGRRTCVVIVEVDAPGDAANESADSDNSRESRHIGLLVDAVNEVLEVRRDEIGERPAFGLGSRSDFVQEMIRRGEQFIVVIEPGQVVASAVLELSPPAAQALAAVGAE